MGGIHQEDRHNAFQEIVDGLPILSGAFHRHMRHASLHEPVGQRQELVGHGAKGFQFGTPFGSLSCAIRHQTTGGDTLFMHIESRTIRKDHLHLASPLQDWASGIPLCIKTALRA
jgi:hypothetical protein